MHYMIMTLVSIKLNSSITLFSFFIFSWKVLNLKFIIRRINKFFRRINEKKENYFRNKYFFFKLNISITLK